jgi:hypothetical protein
MDFSETASSCYVPDEGCLPATEADVDVKTWRAMQRAASAAEAAAREQDTTAARI